MTSFILRSSATALAVALVLFAWLVQRNLARGAGELLESDRAFDAGQVELSVLHARAAASAYVPGAEHVRLAYARLRAVARGAESARDIELSRVAWRAMRAAAIESRHLWQPRSEELNEADREIERLSGALASNAAVEHPAGLPAWALGGLVAGAACAMLGLWSLCGGGADFGFLRLGQDADRPEARAAGSRLRLAVLSCALGVLLWSLALLNA